MNIRGFADPVIPALTDVKLQQQNRMPSSVPPSPIQGFGMRHVWRPSMLVHKLEQLQQQSPEQFKQIIVQLADSLQQIANKSGSANSPVSQLAQTFKLVADTGDITALGQLLHHPDLATHLQGAGNEPTGVDATLPASGGHSFGAILSAYTGDGVAAAFGTAVRQINEALQVATTNASSNSSGSMSTGTAVKSPTPADVSSTPAVPSATHVSNTAAVSSAVSSQVADDSTYQPSIAAIENAAIMAIKSSVPS